jgi:hypothetical protein
MLDTVRPTGWVDLVAASHDGRDVGRVGESTFRGPTTAADLHLEAGLATKTARHTSAV